MFDQTAESLLRAMEQLMFVRCDVDSAGAVPSSPPPSIATPRNTNGMRKCLARHREIDRELLSLSMPMWYRSVDDAVTKFTEECKSAIEQVRPLLTSELPYLTDYEKITLTASPETVALVASQSKKDFTYAAYATILRIREHIGPTSPVDAPIYKAIEKGKWKKKSFLTRKEQYEGKDVHKLSEEQCLAWNYLTVRTRQVEPAVNRFSQWLKDEAIRLVRNNAPRGFRVIDMAAFEEESSDDECAHPPASSPRRTPRSAFTRSPLPKLCYCVFRSAPHGIDPIMESHGATFMGKLIKREEINSVLAKVRDHVQRAAGHEVLVVTVLQIAGRIPSNELATAFAKEVLKLTPNHVFLCLYDTSANHSTFPQAMLKVCQLAGEVEGPLVSTYRSELPKGGVGSVHFELEYDKINRQLEEALRKAGPSQAEEEY